MQAFRRIRRIRLAALQLLDKHLQLTSSPDAVRVVAKEIINVSMNRFQASRGWPTNSRFASWYRDNEEEAARVAALLGTRMNMELCLLVLGKVFDRAPVDGDEKFELEMHLCADADELSKVWGRLGSNEYVHVT